jgi:serine protease Do
MHSGRFLARRSSPLGVILLSAALGASLAVHGAGSDRADARDGRERRMEGKAALALLEDGFAAVAEKVEPAVVTVTARATMPPHRFLKEEGPDNSLSAPFRSPDPLNTPSPPRGTSSGSGLIVRAEGNSAYVLTNEHVVRRRDRVRVTLQDRSVYDAFLAGTDERADLALLRIDLPRPLPERCVAQLGDSDRVRVGQWAIAIGSPFGYDETFTVGVISARGRCLGGPSLASTRDPASPSEPLPPGRRSYTDLLQTDAAINLGNSGGPLVNIDGDVVGVNVLIAPAPGTTGSVGIGFAIPINRARTTLDQLLAAARRPPATVAPAVVRDPV